MTDPVAPEPAPGAGDEADAVSADDLARLVDRVPPGWTEVAYGGRTWGLSRTDRAEGRTTTLWAEELGGSGFVSANVWRTSGGEVLRPCEMPAETVLDLLRGWTPHEDGQGDH